MKVKKHYEEYNKFKEDMFFTIGEKQIDIQTKNSEKNIKSEFFFNTKLEYEINAAINFELCCKAKKAWRAYLGF